MAWGGAGGHPVCVITMHCVRKSICDSSLGHGHMNYLPNNVIWMSAII